MARKRDKHPRRPALLEIHRKPLRVIERDADSPRALVVLVVKVVNTPDAIVAESVLWKVPRPHWIVDGWRRCSYDGMESSANLAKGVRTQPTSRCQQVV